MRLQGAEEELASFWNLSVTVLRGQFEHTYDNLSEPELYVTLNLPTALDCCPVQTKTIKNCKTPEWNETFHFSVSSLAKNVLETALCDSNSQHKKEDKVYSFIMLDINTLKLGQKEIKEFIMVGKKGPTQFWNLSVTVLRGTFEHVYDLCSDPDLYVTLKLPTVSDCCTVRTKTINDCKTPEWNETFHFHVCSLVENIMEIKLYDSDLVVDEKCAEIKFDISTLKLGQKETKEFITDDKLMDKLWLEFEITESSEKDIKVRLDFDIPAEEKEFLVKRREVVSRALQTFLNLDTPLDPTKVPIVAVVCSGGGSRAMTGTYGSLKGLQSLGLLDVITYITSVSGSTWTAASLYSDQFWSKDEGLDKAIASAKEELSKSVVSLFSFGSLCHYASELQKRKKEGHQFSFIDLWGLVIERIVFGEKPTGTLSDQKMAVSDSQNPLPIYTSVNMKEGACGLQPEWCEFTPFEVGFSKYGAFVNAKNFGSEFHIGHVMKNLPQTRIPFLLELHPDAFPNQLTPADSTLGLVDSGFAINTGFPPVLRPHRHADVILCLENSWVDDRLTTLKKTQQYCSDHKLPFPNIDITKYESEPTREVYVFEDEDNPDAPIVICFPLANVSFKEYKAPGVKRGDDELNEGNIDVSTKDSPYRTIHLTYKPEDFQKLVDLTSYNIVNNEEAKVGGL
ncbi:cytosolic phospholipase A2 zeta-like [Clarias gariepinus]